MAAVYLERKEQIALVINGLKIIGVDRTFNFILCAVLVTQVSHDYTEFQWYE